MSNIVGDGKFYVPADKLKAKDQLGRRQNQPLSQDWVEFTLSTAGGTAIFTYSSATRISIHSSITPSDYFQKGDMLWIIQGGVSKYFFIIAVGASYIDVSAGNVYTVASATIQYFATSRDKSKPAGFPGAFTFDPGLNSGGVGSVTAITYIQREFYMTGDIMHIYISFQFTSGGGGQDTVYFDPPASGFNYGSSGIINIGSLLAVGSTFIPTYGYGFFNSGGAYDEVGMSASNDSFLGSNQALLGKIEYKVV